jgi:Kdo2-lipid IVA lauroyltransferase/acyltransferase
MKTIEYWFKTLIRHPLEAAGVYLCLFIFKSLSPENASAFGGWITRKLGPVSDAQTTAHRNLAHAYPNNTKEQNAAIIRGVWDNFGRDMGEYPHLAEIDIYNDPRFEIVGAEYVDQLRDDNKPAVIFGAHLASWEVAIMGMTQRGLKVTQMYRATNNPYVDRLIRSVQEGIGKEVLNKGPNDARRILELLNHGDHLFLLVDQKLNRGMPIPFFGRDAMTAPAGARMAIRYDCPFLPVRVERLGGFKFRITYYPPLEVSHTGDLNHDLHETLCRMNGMIEEWVRERPDQWLWIHKRWPKDPK